VSIQPNLSHQFARVLLLLSAPCLFAACGPKTGTPRLPPAGPFTVSDYFAASGAMADGNGMSPPGMITTNQYAGSTCGDKARPPGARGHCFTFDYVPGPNLFAGVYFQYPPNNWGGEKGLPVHADKFSKVSFQYAVADNNQTMLKFGIGGIGLPMHSADDIAKGYTNSDQFALQDTPQSATSEWQPFSLAIRANDPNVPITDIIGAFAWYASYPMGADFTTLPPTTVYIDDLVYE
jgi:hypothetical protein